MQTMKVKPWAEGQGDYVVINADDFDATLHEALDPVGAAAEAVPHSSDDAQTAPARRGRKAKAE